MLKLHQDVKYAVPPNLRLSKNKHHLNGSNVATVADYARENEIVIPLHPRHSQATFNLPPCALTPPTRSLERGTKPTPLDHSVLILHYIISSKFIFVNRFVKIKNAQ